MKHLLLVLFFLVCSTSILFSQRVSGFVHSGQSKESLIGATLYDMKTQGGTVTDANGYFSWVSKSPSVHLRVTYLGYASQDIHLNLTSDTLLYIQLQSKGIELPEAEVFASARPKFNVISLSSQQLNMIPSITGKPDIMKALQFMPGFQTQGEGSSIIMVRGGSPGENQYLLDNIPLIYVNHLGGFFSVFNPDMINGLEVYKSNFPSRFGGKLSSVMNITQKQGDRSGIKGNLSIGISDFSFSVEGPMSQKSSFILTGRKSMIDPFMAMLGAIVPENNFIMFYGFHDVNAKFSWFPDAKNSFHLNIYEGDDYLNHWTQTVNPEGSSKNQIGHIWGNVLTSAHWRRTLSKQWHIENSLSYTRYRLKDLNTVKSLNSDIEKDKKNIYLSSIQDLSLRSSAKYSFSSWWNLEFGLQASWFLNKPNERIEYKNSKKTHYVDPQNSLDLALYWDNDFCIGRYIDLHVGLRLNTYLIKKYFKFSPEPRASIDFKITKDQILNLGYMRISQNTQLLFVPGSINNSEIWIFSDKDIPTSYSNQYNLGWKGFFHKQMFEVGLELYYKDFSGLSTMKNGYTTISGDAFWKQKIAINGIGTAYGIEFLLRKNIGKWTGFTSYTYARSFRQFADINQGHSYVYDYDRPHTFTLGVNWQITQKWSVSLTWIYQTGLPYTPAIGSQLVPSTNIGSNIKIVANDDPNQDPSDPSGLKLIAYFYPEYLALIYGEQNSARMRDYHRLDIGAQYNYITKRGRRACWSISIYNVYNRHNPYYYYYNEPGNTGGGLYNPATTQDKFRPISLYQ
ncbi:MAG: carboxypeptidase-like regulatory domain-containing protein, partial [Bacteroidales bacterium]